MTEKKSYKTIYACMRCGVDVDIEELFGGWVRNIDTVAEDCLCPGCQILRTMDLEKEIEVLNKKIKTLTTGRESDLEVV